MKNDVQIDLYEAAIHPKKNTDEEKFLLLRDRSNITQAFFWPFFTPPTL